jgi:predicted metal-dependent hydrolase
MSRAAGARRELYPRLSPRRRAQLLRRGRALFHGGRAFAAHECWETVWRSTDPEPRDLFQGLVQLAAAFHHLDRRGRPDVARRVLAKARRRLAAVEPVAAGAAGVRLAALLPQLAAWDAWLADGRGQVPPRVRLG